MSMSMGGGGRGGAQQLPLGCKWPGVELGLS